MKKLVLAIGLALSAAVCTAGESKSCSLPFSPVGIGLAAPVQIPWTCSDVYGLRIGGLLGVESEVIGLDIGLVEVTKEDFTGLQLSGFSWTGGDALLFGLSAVANVTKGSAIGLSVSACNVVYGDFTGLAAGLVNVDAALCGAQIAAVNWNRFASAGAQIGLYNRNCDCFSGCAVSAVSFSKDFTGLQLGVINSADKAAGLQLGVINACEEMTGVQIGFINLIASSPVSAMVVANMAF